MVTSLVIFLQITSSENELANREDPVRRLLRRHIGARKSLGGIAQCPLNTPLYSIDGCIAGQSRNSESCHSHWTIIGVKELIRRWDTRTWRDVSSYIITYLPLNYDTLVLPERFPWDDLRKILHVCHCILISDIWALWRSALSARVSKCQKLKMQVRPGWHWTLWNVIIWHHCTLKD